MGGLGYGGWVLLNDIQRVGFAPSQETPESAAAAPINVANPGLSGEPVETVALGLDTEARRAGARRALCAA